MILVLLACSGAQTAIDVGFNASLSGSSAQTVQGALDELYVRCAAVERAAASPVASEQPSTAALAARVQELEFKVAKLESEGLYDATQVTYDPRATTLAARTLQTAVDELEARVQKVEAVDQGAPGPALFELRDKNGNLVTAGKGPSGGPQGRRTAAGADRRTAAGADRRTAAASADSRRRADRAARAASARRAGAEAAEGSRGAGLSVGVEPHRARADPPHFEACSRYNRALKRRRGLAQRHKGTEVGGEEKKKEEGGKEERKRKRKRKRGAPLRGTIVKSDAAGKPTSRPGPNYPAT